MSRWVPEMLIPPGLRFPRTSRLGPSTYSALTAEEDTESTVLGEAADVPTIDPEVLERPKSLTSCIAQPWVSSSSVRVSILLVLCSCITSTTIGYDASMMNGLNMLTSYTEYFDLSTTSMSVATSSIYIGGVVAGLTYARVTDAVGRRHALFWAAIVTLFSVVMQSAARDIATFVVGRILVGYGTSASCLTGPTYLAETLPYKWRAWGIGLLNDFYYVGGLLAAAVTYRTANLESTMAWRIPSAVQGVFSVLCIAILPFIPESPRWLVFEGRREEALIVMAQTYADGDTSNPTALAQYKQVVETLDHERTLGEALSLAQLATTPMSRKRVSLAISVAIFSTVSGNVIASYYLGPMLATAGIDDTTTQLQINIVLNAFCLCCALAGTYYSDKLGRRLTGLISTVLLTVFIFLIGLLTKAYGNTTNLTGIHATVAAIFLFQGAYSFGWTPLLFLYPPEVLNYALRARGMGLFTLVLNGTALLCVAGFPFVLERWGWWTYVLNGSWDVLEVGFIWCFWVETMGKTLEEIDGVMDRDSERARTGEDAYAVLRDADGRVGEEEEIAEPMSVRGEWHELRSSRRSGGGSR